jgi:sporulation protein YlmC with PRC-barrel domain
MKIASVAIAAMLLAAPAAFAQTTTPSTMTSADGQFYSHQAGEMRASKLIGTSVVNTANETVGNINEVVLSKEGKVAAIIVGVGGFLGMGEHEVAMNYNSLKFAKDANGRDFINVNATKDQLKAAPAWKWDATTGTPRQQ